MIFDRDAEKYRSEQLELSQTVNGDYVFAKRRRTTTAPHAL